MIKMVEELARKEAIEFLGIPEKHFDNYFKSSREIKGFKKRNISTDSRITVKIPIAIEINKL